MNELLVSQIWHAQWLRRDALRTVDGRTVRVVYRGRWSYGLGPDFQDAMLVFDDGPLLRGDIEVHRQATDWAAHGHATDERYRAVILHVTLDDAPSECRRSDGAILPQLALRHVLRGDLDQFKAPTSVPLGALGHGPCAEQVVATQPNVVLDVIRRAGQQRLDAKVARAAANLAAEQPAQAFYADLLEALGYAENRQAFRDLAARVPLAELDRLAVGCSIGEARVRLSAALLGAGGLLPWPESSGVALRPDLITEFRREWLRLRDTATTAESQAPR